MVTEPCLVSFNIFQLFVANNKLTISLPYLPVFKSKFWGVKIDLKNRPPLIHGQKL